MLRRVESRLPPGVPVTDLGEATSEVLGPDGQRFILVSYLASPVPEKTKLDYVLFALLPAGFNEDMWATEVEVDEYEWEVTSPTDGGFTPIQSFTPTGCFSWSGQRSGHRYVVSVTPRLGERGLANLTLSQSVRQREPRLETKLTKKRKDPGEPDSQRELINDFGDFVRAAAAATGPTGIPSAALAAILYMELNARPKDQTERARMFRRRSRLNRTPTWSEWTAEEVRQQLKAWNLPRWGADFFPLVEIRCVELALVGDVFDDATGFRKTGFGGKSLGVGQIALSTAAMVTGDIPWIEATPGRRDEAAKEVADYWRVLSLRKQIGIFNRLRFPKENIRLAAELLAKLKNRPNRFPALAVGDVLKDEFIIKLLATEYNQGATNSTRDNVQLPTDPGANWRRAIRFVKPDFPIYPELFFQ